MFHLPRGPAPADTQKKHSFMIDGPRKLLSCAVQNLWCKLSNVVVYGIAVHFSLKFLLLFKNILK